MREQSQILHAIELCNENAALVFLSLHLKLHLVDFAGQLLEAVSQPLFVQSQACVLHAQQMHLLPFLLLQLL